MRDSSRKAKSTDLPEQHPAFEFNLRELAGAMGDFGTLFPLAIGYIAAAATSLLVFTATHPARGPWFWQLYYHQELVISGQLLYDGTYWLLAKTTACAAGIAMIAYAGGAAPKDSSRAVSRGVTSTILWATLYVLSVHFLFAFFEFE